MFPYQRLMLLFNHLRGNRFSTIESLSKKLNVSDRTIRSDIQEANKVLMAYGIQIKLKKKVGYYLDIQNEESYSIFLNEYNNGEQNTPLLESVDSRIKYMICTLLYSKDYVSMEALADAIYVSKSTLLNYIKTMRETLSTFHLDIVSKAGEGLKIIGKEEDIRAFLLNFVLTYNFDEYIIGFTHAEYVLFEDIDLTLIEKIVDGYLSKANIKPSDFSRKNLIIHFALMISRNKNGSMIESFPTIEKEVDIETFVRDIINDLESQFHIKINEAEFNYVYSHFVSNTDLKTNVINQDNLDLIMEDILNNIYENYYFDLRNDVILYQDLFLHLRSILKTKEVHLNKRNPLLNTIKSNFPLPYEITLTAISQIGEKYNLSLTEDEIGYISLHIGSSIERCYANRDDKKNAILVCGSGQATSRMLEARINACFKDRIVIIKRLSYSEFKQMKKEDFTFVDFAISTVEIDNPLIPTMSVDFALDHESIAKLSAYLNTQSEYNLKKIEDFFAEDIFSLNQSYQNKEAVLQDMCKMLVKGGYANDDFYENVMKREKIGNTNMDNVFALPHPMSICANDTKVAVAILKNPIPWNHKEEIQIVFMLAIKKSDHMNIEHLYDTFMNIINNPKLQSELIHVEDFTSFMDIIVHTL